MSRIKYLSRMIMYLSWTEIQSRYARSVIGPFWIVLTNVISVVGLGYIWSILFKAEKETFIPSLTMGLIIWQFIASCITEGPTCFLTYGPIIRNYPHPLWIYPAVLVIKNLIVFLHNLVIILAVLLLYPQGFGWETILILPSLLVVTLIMIQVSTLLAFIGARYRDFAPAVVSFMSILFFLSPVIFRPGQLGVKAKMVWLNPLSYMITIVRDPLTGKASEGFVYFATLLFVFLGTALAQFFIKRYSSRALFWI